MAHLTRTEREAARTLVANRVNMLYVQLLDDLADHALTWAQLKVGMAEYLGVEAIDDFREFLIESDAEHLIGDN